MKKFIKKIFIYICILSSLFLVTLIYIYVISGKPTTINDFLYHYQVDKIQSTKPLNTVFLGDSSLGNSINCDSFSVYTVISCVNLALSGVYGYEGTYNMLKKTLKYHPEVKNIVLMHSIDMMTRSVSIKGYAYSMSSITDFNELNLKEKAKTVMAFLQIKDNIFSISNSIFLGKKIDSEVLHDGYIKQVAKVDFTDKEETFTISQIKNDKIKFLKKIVDLCKKQNINLIYLHGPIYNKTAELSTGYLTEVNNKIKETGVTLVDTIISGTNNDFGDEPDHVIPEKKYFYTKIYADILNSLLIK